MMGRKVVKFKVDHSLFIKPLGPDEFLFIRHHMVSFNYKRIVFINMFMINQNL